ncbi:Atxe2 family lasso peptide isopeptidase [Sphingopyxis italica]|uniref:Atxe2 family lasso peptide isopeptidase n=1 Tax=Sphingopyxis italica TaxID=1129133 RepID=UPI001AD9BFA2
MFAGLLAAAAAAGPDQGVRAPVTTRDLVEVSDITAPTLSPDGRRIAWRLSLPSVDENVVKLRWHVADIDGRSTPVLLDGGVARPDASGALAETAPVWDADSGGFRYLALKDGVQGIWHWRDDMPLEREVVDEADITEFGPSGDGRELKYSIGATRSAIAKAESSAYRDGVLVDGSINLNQPIAGGVIEDGRRVMRRFSSPWFDNRRILWNVEATEKTLMPRDPAHRPAPSAPGQGLESRAANGDIAEIVEERSEQRLRVTRADGRVVACVAAPCRSGKLRAVAWRGNHDALLLFVKDSSERETVWLWTVGESEAKRLTVTSGALRVPGQPPRCAVGEDALYCADAQPLVPPRLVRTDFASGRTQVLAEPNRALAARIAAKAEPMTWPGGFTGYFLKPIDTNGPLPVVVHYYTCEGFLKGGSGDEIPMLPLTEHGIAVLCIDAVRAPRAAGMEGSYNLALKTIGSALDELAAQGKIDPSRVGIGGLSFGSSVALWAIRKSRRFAAATIASGQISPHYYWMNALPDRGFTSVLEEIWGLGPPEATPDRWKTVTPLWDIESLATPLLMQVPESEAQSNVELHTRLRRAGRPAEMVVFADELHIKYQPAHKRASYERNLDWYRFWLKGEEDDEPEKAEQYRRWRHYRAGQSLPVSAR